MTTNTKIIITARLKEVITAADDLAAADGRDRVVVHNPSNPSYGFDEFCIVTRGAAFIRQPGSTVVYETGKVATDD